MPRFHCGPRQLKWFDRWLKGSTMSRSREHPVRIFVMGINQWRDEEEWPLARARNEKFYLDRNGRTGQASRIRQPVGSRQLSFTTRAIRCLRSAARCAAIPSVFPWGPMDQRGVEKRRDVLVYSTAPLAVRYRGHGTDQGGALRLFERARYGFHRQAGGRFPGRTGAEPDGRHSARALSGIAGNAEADDAGRGRTG